MLPTFLKQIRFFDQIDVPSQISNVRPYIDMIAQFYFNPKFIVPFKNKFNQLVDSFSKEEKESFIVQLKMHVYVGACTDWIPFAE